MLVAVPCDGVHCQHGRRGFDGRELRQFLILQ